MEPIPDKIQFVSNLNGTTILEVNLISGISVLCLVVRAYAITLLPPFVMKNLTVRFLIDYVMIFLPLLCSVTILCQYIWNCLLVGTILSLSVLYIFFKIRKKPMDFFTNSCYLAPNFYTDVTRVSDSESNVTVKPKETTSPSVFLLSSNIPFVTSFRAMVNIASCICILAVDFHVYPRRLAKVEKFGVSMMDLGVGGFIIANAIVSPEARKANQSDYAASVRKKSRLVQLLSSWPIIVLGMLRLVSVKATGYQEHISEYGVHWNFFFSLALVKVLATLVLWCVEIKHCIWISAFIGCGYQYVLSAPSFGMESFLLSDTRDGNILVQNKEGIASSIGFVALYFAGIELGAFLFKQRSTWNEWKRAAVQLLSFSIVMWTTLFLTITYVQPVSRRLGNMTYVLWIISYTSLFLVLYLLVDLLLVAFIARGSLAMECMPNRWILVSAQTRPKNVKINHAPPPVTTCLLSAVNSNQLFYFLLCNLLTGLVNFTVQTLSVSDTVAMLVIVSYCLSSAVVIWLLQIYNITLKFW